MTPLGIDKVTRLVVLFTLLMVVLLVGGGWIFHGLMVRGFREAGLQAVRDHGRLMRSLLEVRPEGPLAAWEHLDAEAMRVAAGLDRLDVVPFGADAAAGRSIWEAPVLPDSLREELELGCEVLPEPIYENGEFYQSVYEPLLDRDGQTLGYLLLESGDRASRRMAAWRRGLWLATGLAGLFVFFVFLTMSGILSRARRHQRDLDRAEHLARVGTLAAGLAHEIRNPLAIIAANAELIEMNAAGVSERNKADDILEEVERLQRLLGDFLHFARPGGLEAAPVDLDAFWSAAVREQSALHPEIDYVFDPAGDLPRMRADEDKLRQLALNLLGNAAQALGGRGEIRVSVSRERNTARVRIRDDGPGVPPELRETLFRPFVSGRRGGSGLGLAVCGAIARAHGGDLRLASPGEGGAEFVLELPLKSAE